MTKAQVGNYEMGKRGFTSSIVIFVNELYLVGMLFCCICIFLLIKVLRH